MRALQRTAILLGFLFCNVIFVLTAEGNQEEQLKLGVVRDSPPFSFDEMVTRSDSQPVHSVSPQGYSVDLCKQFAQSYYDAEQFENGTTGSLVTISPTSDRFTFLRRGYIDVLCEATTATLEVQAGFSASLYTFVTTRGFAYQSDFRPSGTSQIKVGFLRGTTSEEYREQSQEKLKTVRLLRQWNGEFVEITVGSHFEGQRKLLSGEIEIYVADAAILDFLFQRGKNAGSAITVADTPIFAMEPYALIMRRDDRRIIDLNRFLKGLYQSDEIFRLLAKWFPDPSIVDRVFLDLVRFQSLIPTSTGISSAD